MNILKDLRKLSLRSRNIFGQVKMKYFFISKQTKAEFIKKLQEGRYYSILGFDEKTNIRALTDTEIRRRYLTMVRKYHSDNIIEPSQKLQYEQITKCIILANQKILAQRIANQINKGTYQNIYQDQDHVAMRLFGKKFNEIKYDLFKQENSPQRKLFMELLQEIRKESRYYQYVKSQQQTRSNDFRQRYRQSQFGHIYVKVQPGPVQEIVAKNYIPLYSFIGLLIAGIMYKNHVDRQEQQLKRKKDKHTLGQEKIREIEKKSIQLYQKKLNDLINSFVEQMPPSLKYPTKNDPQQIDQLIEYTIGPDINLYQISSKILGIQSNLQKLKNLKSLQETKIQFGPQFNPFPMTKIKVNSAISLSLQAQRCLQNIYIKVKDVADQIQQTGKYTPPKVFFRFYGYLMFQIRQKPLSLQNYRNTEYVSLFDLFFDYYSPIPLKRHQYNEYVVGIQDEDLKLYGQVHLNHRKIPERYISREDKIVVMRDNASDAQEKYQAIWHNFYQKYMQIWRRGYSDRVAGL